MNLSETNETLTFDVDCINPKLIRKLFGLPEKPLSKLKRRRKTFKKALMAYGKSRDKAEEICHFIEYGKGQISYSSLCENIINLLGR